MKFIKRDKTKGSLTNDIRGASGIVSNNSSDNSSTTLESHRIWGLLFDGTNDVAGDMQNVGSITATGNILTDESVIIKLLDADGNEVEGGDLTISVEDKKAKFSGKDLYVFDRAIEGTDIKANGNLDVTGASTMNRVTITGDAIMNSATVTSDATMNIVTVNGNAAFNKNIEVKGQSNLTNVTSTNITNSDTINTKNLWVTGSSTMNGVTVNGDATFNKNIEVKGKSKLNDVSSNNITNSDTIKTKNLEVTGLAHFFELIIDKIKAAGGAVLFTPANGFKVDIVESVTDGYKLYWLADDGSGNLADNMWKVNDLALCMSFNQAKEGTNHNISNKYYWSLVTAVSDTNQPVSIEEKKYHYIVISTVTKDGTVNPEIGDSIVMCGYRGTDDMKRQSAIYISAYTSLDKGLTAPLLAQYRGINDFNLESHRKSYFDAVSAKFVGNFEVSNGLTIEDYINKKVTDSVASIKLDNKNIVLLVSEKTQERRNLLVGSAFKRKSNNFTIRTGARIEMNSGYNGTNCIKVIDDTDGTGHYIGVYWDGSQGGRSVKIEKGKKYTISCYYKTNNTNAKCTLEAIYTDKETNAKRLGLPKLLSPNQFYPKYNQWQLFTTVIDTTDAESDYIAFNFWEGCNVNAGIINAYICRPMVEEGDTYYGWTLSDEDNDYVGANLIDNSRTFQVGGNTLIANGTKTLKGDVYELTYKSSAQYNTFYKIDTTNFKLDTDYTLSFDVRGDAKPIGVHVYYPITKTPYTLLNEAMGKQMLEQSGDGNSEALTTLLTNDDIKKEKKLWVHFKFMKRLPSYIYFQFPDNSDQSGVTSWGVTITKPKIEEGANVTEWTEKKTDVEKSLTTITNNVATLTQKASSIESNVTSNTTNINNITGQLSSQSTLISKLDQKADSIDSKVDANTNSITELGTNLETTNSNVTALETSVNEKYAELNVKADGISGKVEDNTKKITILNSNLEETNSNITALEATVSNNYSTLDQKADGIAAKVASNTNSITALGTNLETTNGNITKLETSVNEKYAALDIKADGINSKVSDNTDKITALGTNLNTTNSNITALETTVSNNYSTLDQKTDGISTKVASNTTKITKLGENLNATNESITSLQLTVTDNYSTLDQKADGISAKVSENTTTINSINGQVTTNKTDIANLTTGIGNLQTSIDNIAVGGRNLITNSINYRKATPLVHTSSNGDGSTEHTEMKCAVTLLAGKTYIMQCKSDGTLYTHSDSGTPSSKYYTVWLRSSTKNYCFTTTNLTGTDSLGAKYWKFNVDKTNDYWFRTNSYSDGSTSVTIKFWDIKLEEGTVKTDWTPAPEDISSNFTTVTNSISSINQKANSIESKVTSNTTTINNLSGSVTSLQSDMSNVKQTASSITSTVSSMKDDILGANCMLGLNGQGWSSNTIYDDSGNLFHCDSTDWFQSHPIMDYAGDYTFSFGFWGGTTQIKILDFTQTYYDDGIYDQYVDFGPYTPCKILTTVATVPNATLTNYATSGTSSNWTYTNTETITLKVGDNVAVRVTNGDNKRYNSIYGTVSAINTSSKSVKVKAIALLDQPNTICTLSCPTDKKDGTAINSLHYDEKLGRYWIRFKETRGSAKTFVILFRNLSASNVGWISRLMLEESVEYPHKYNNTGQASQSMIKQTANEILMSVNDTYVKIGDGNITLNGDTKVNGSLTLNDKKQGFLLLGNGGTTEISPNSIGTYNEFASKTTNVIKTQYDSKIYGYKAEDGDYYRFSWTVLQRLGTFKKGTYIKILNYTNYAYAIGATSHISTPYATFYIYENGKTTKTINVNNETSVDIANYTVVGDNVDVIVDGHFTIGVPTSIWGYIDPHYKPAIGVSVNWNNEVPKASSTFMLIGYDGWGISFGTNKTVYCGKDGFVAKYGDNEFRITDTGISHNNMATTYTIIGTSSSSSPTTYTVQDPVDTVLCKSGYCKVIFPSNPYNGQRIKIYDKSSEESYINSNGKYVCGANRRYSDRSIWTNQNLPDMAVRIYTYINDTWYEEYTG